MSSYVFCPVDGGFQGRHRTVVPYSRNSASALLNPEKINFVNQSKTT